MCDFFSVDLLAQLLLVSFGHWSCAKVRCGCSTRWCSTLMTCGSWSRSFHESPPCSSAIPNLKCSLVSVDIRSPHHSQQRGFTSLCSFSTAIIYIICRFQVDYRYIYILDILKSNYHVSIIFHPHPMTLRPLGYPGASFIPRFIA